MEIPAELRLAAPAHARLGRRSLRTRGPSRHVAGSATRGRPRCTPSTSRPATANATRSSCGDGCAPTRRPTRAWSRTKPRPWRSSRRPAVTTPALVAFDVTAEFADAPALVMTRLQGHDVLAPPDLDEFLDGLVASLRAILIGRGPWARDHPSTGPWGLEPLARLRLVAPARRVAARVRDRATPIPAAPASCVIATSIPATCCGITVACPASSIDATCAGPAWRPMCAHSARTSRRFRPRGRRRLRPSLRAGRRPAVVRSRRHRRRRGARSLALARRGAPTSPSTPSCAPATTSSQPQSNAAPDLSVTMSTDAASSTKARADGVSGWARCRRPIVRVSAGRAAPRPRPGRRASRPSTTAGNDVPAR